MGLFYSGLLLLILSVKILHKSLYIVVNLKNNISSAETQTLFNITLAREGVGGGCVRSSQGDYEDRLVEEVIKTAISPIYPHGPKWRHKEKCSRRRTKTLRTNRATALVSEICVYSSFQLLRETLTSQE